MQHIDIIPSILVQTEQAYADSVTAVKEHVSMVQIDIADGVFVPNTTWADPDTISDTLEIDCELHLMVVNPLEEARRWEHVSQVKRVLVHYESITPDTASDILGAIHSYGWDIGLVLNPQTPVSVIDTHIEDIDMVMLMGVTPGFQGQPFIEETLERIQTIHTTYPSLKIAVDGGVNIKTIPNIISAGAHIICPGSAIFGNEQTPEKNIQTIKKIIESA